MGAFKIQTDLDLSGFNLLNFCIQSYTDLENVPNLGLGRKLFFTGNSTDEKNLREVIWNGVEWKAAVYLDDIEALTNGEGSLGTRVKALEDMLKVDDANDVINTWAEIQAFLDQVQEGTDLMNLLNGKAEWAERIPDLSFKHIGYGYAGQGFWTSGPALSFGANANYFGQIQMDIMPVPTIKIRSYNKGYGEWQTLIHSGNVGDYALKTDGSNKMEAPLKLFSGDISTVNYHGLFVGTANISDGAAFNYGAFISIPDRGTSQLQLSWYRSYHSPQLAIRLHESNNWSDWKTLAFTDSTVAAAKKLTTDSHVYASFSDTGKCLLFGATAAEQGYSTYVDGYNIHFRYGGGYTSAMTITEEGNVLVGNVAENDGTPLKVSTRIHVSGTNQTAPSLGSAPTSGLLVGTNNLGISQWVGTSGQGHIQVGRFDGTATAYALNLNPLGGAVNVGDGGLNVKGGIVMSGGSVLDKISATSTLNIVSEQGQIYISSNTETDFTTAKGSIFFNGETFTPWTQNNNAISLGRSGARWSNVYSTLGDFNGAVTIHSNADGAELLRFDTDRPWKFSQLGTGAATSLCLLPDATSKKFIIADSDTSNVFEFWVNGSNSNAIFNSKLTVANLATFNGSALIPTGKKMLFGKNGSAIEYDADANAIKVTGNIYATGTVASGGKATVGEGDNGGGGNANVYSDVLEGVITQEWEVGNPFQKEDVIVSLYMWNTDESRWKMFLADIGVTSENIWVTFGRPTSTSDKFMAVVMG